MRQTYRSPTSTITIIRPNKSRKTFGLRLESVDCNGHKKTDSKVFKDDETLKSVNHAFKNGIYDYNHANHLVEKLKKQLEPRFCQKISESGETLEINKANTRLFNKYWSDVYLDRDVKARTTKQAKKQFERILKLYGSTSLTGATKHEIRRVWEEFDCPHQGKVRLSTRLNALLNYAERGFTIKMKKRDRLFVDYKTYVEEQDLIILVAMAGKNEDKLALRIGFYLGLRNGEIFGLQKKDFEKKTRRLKVRRQLVAGEGYYDECKADSARDIPVPKHLVSTLEEWLNIPIEKKKLNDKKFGRRLKDLSRRCFPDDELKQISPHGLRRSFAKHYYGKGVDISGLAMLMGDKEETVRNNYLGLKLTSGMFESLKNQLEK
tara:strand:- start:32944 stop:34074 length:1131 start_codon:yes stop_codon:yes gene_type:complete